MVFRQMSSSELNEAERIKQNNSGQSKLNTEAVLEENIISKPFSKEYLDDLLVKRFSVKSLERAP